ncbi:class III lanthionine synthetase LanKC [Streptomyces sirii]|uniref:class III lanthionine synthetase LanKC n=1 Tax=Streptomyces sirii TaxID=3127701 RepID=UPI003D369E16
MSCRGGRPGAARPRPPRARVPGAGVGFATGVPRAASGGALGHHHRRPPVRHRAGAALLQRRRGVRRAGPADPAAGGAEGGTSVRRTGCGRGGRGDPARAGTGRPAAAVRAGVRPRGAGLVHARRALLPGAGVHRGSPAQQLLRASAPADRVRSQSAAAGRVHRMGTARAPARGGGRRGDPRPGVVFNDLHLFNIMLSEDESSVVLLDFEAASIDDPGSRQVIANPGFVAPADRRGPDVDRYALACLRLALFLPLTSLFAVDRAKSRHLARIAAEQFPVPAEFLDAAVDEILRGDRGVTGAAGLPQAHSGSTDGGKGHGYLPASLADWPRSRDSAVRAVLASATPAREDRIFPGDIAQFALTGGGTCFAYGAAGVLYALDATGAERCPQAEEWLLQRTKAPASGSPVGFYDGLSGVAWVLDRLGHRARALDLMDLVTAQSWQDIGPDLHGGLAGVGLALDSLAETADASGLREQALRCAELVADRLGRTTAGEGPAPSRAGLLHGDSGAALLFLRLYERTGDGALLDLAGDALRRDLARCVRSASGTLQVDEGWRTMPYLGAGSVGIGMVLDDYLSHRPDDGFAATRDEIVRAAQAKFYAQPGLFRGAAGMVLYLSRTTAQGPGTGAADLRRQIDSLSWGAVPYQGHLAFAGEQMMRLSMDLSTGTAGCLLALGSALHDEPVHLPFLPPLRRP